MPKKGGKLKILKNLLTMGSKSGSGHLCELLAGFDVSEHRLFQA